MKPLNKLKNNKSGVVWIWVVIIVGILAYSLIWFSVGWVVIEVADNVESQYTYEPPISYAASFIRLIFQYHPILFFFGLMLWAYVNSQRNVQLQ